MTLKFVTYRELLNVYWHGIDPTRSDGQFCDIGKQYRPLIFYLNEEQHHLAEQSKKEVSQKISSVKVDILPAETFYPAEEYHQKYYKKSPYHYNRYHEGSGRDERLREIWGD